MVSFLDQLPELRFRFSKKEVGDYALKRLGKFDIDGLDDLISNLMDLSNSGLFSQLFEVYVDWEDPVDSLDEIAMDMAAEHPFFVFAREYLKKNPFAFFSDLINFSTFFYFYPFLEWLYSLYLGRNLKSEDVKLLFCSGIFERIIFNLEDFDSIEEVPETSKEFFENLKELNWENGKTRKIYRELNLILTCYCLSDSSLKERTFKGKYYEVILFLAGCSAVKNGRNKITVDDVLTAHRTFYKIIRTDISKLIEETSSKKITISGYMVCKKCGGHYQLQPGESPDDFSDTCECGGKLEFVSDIDNLHLND